MLIVIPEKTTAYLRVVLRDKDRNLAIPTAITWRVIDVGTGTVLQAETPYTPLAHTFEVKISSTLNAIQVAANAEETRRVVIHAEYSPTDQLNDQYDYVVKNLSGIT